MVLWPAVAVRYFMTKDHLGKQTEHRDERIVAIRI